MITYNGVDYYTHNQWYDKHRIVLEDQRDKGVERTWRTYHGNVTMMFYHYDQTREMTPAERERQRAAARKQRQDRAARKQAEIEREIREEQEREDNRKQTAWQWLERERRIPNDDAEAIGDYPYYWERNDYCQWEKVYPGDKIFYYYRKCDTHRVDDVEYERLKKMYIDKYGGWDKIDLDNTTYDGHIWW